MATGKLRSSKRNSSSSSSYMSTITMVVFIGLCGLGLWMLTSSSVVPPQSVHTSTNSFSHSDNHHVVNSRKDRKVPSFDDTPGDLPDDAVKEDNSNSNQEDTTSIKSDDDSFMDKTHDELKLSNQDEDSKSSNEDNNEQENNKDGSSSDVNEDNSSSKESAEEEQQQQKQEENQESNTSVDNDTNGNGNENQEISTETNTDTESKDEDQNNQEVQQSHEEQIQQDPEVITTKENTEQTTQQRDPESESKDNSNQTDMDNSQQTQQSDSSSGAGDDNQTQTQSSEDDNNQQTQEESSTTGSDETQQQNSDAEIQEVTNDETQSQTQSSTEEDNQQQQNSDTTTSSNDETQQTQTNEEEQSQQTTESENQEQQQNSESETSTESNQEETTTQSTEDKPAESNSGDSFPTGAHAGIPKESKESNRAWSTHADRSENQKERSKDGSTGNKDDGSMYGYTWELCNVTSGADYIPCLDNEKAIKMLHYTGQFEHRERHCPEDAPTCLVPIPKGYKKTIEWPTSRDKIWYHNVPHSKLAEVKGHQNWVKVNGEFLTFPGGGTQLQHGALYYMKFIQKFVPTIAWGKRTRVILDVGCGVTSFGGYLFERDVLAMSFAPEDEHEAQVQFALERGIPAISAVMGSQRLPFPCRVFDLVHCARCGVSWHAEGGRHLLELNRVLRPGGYFVWSDAPFFRKFSEEVEIWKAMSELTISICWELITISKNVEKKIGAAIYRKPTSNECYEQRKHNDPPMCKGDDDANAAWYVPLQACIHRVPTNEVERGAQWPEKWPARVHKPPYWLNSSHKGIYGKPAPEDFATDYEHWKRVVTKSYVPGLGISWSNVRNVMDMRAVYGGFAAALKDIKVWDMNVASPDSPPIIYNIEVWVMNVVNVDSPDTLPIIYERGLFGMYHDWCESFSTYPRTYDLLHADHLFSRLKKRCKLVPVIVEVDRIVRPGGTFIVRDESSVLGEIENMLKSLHWEIRSTFSKDQEGILSAQKSDWRPD